MGSDDAFMFDKEQAERRRAVIAVDLDGTLATYDGWRGLRHIGDPVPAVVARVKEARRRGWRVWIYTARVDHHTNVENAYAIGVIEEWCRKHIGETLPITSTKRRDFTEMWDDRAVGIAHNEGIARGAWDALWDDLGTAIGMEASPTIGAYWIELDAHTHHFSLGWTTLRVELTNRKTWVCWFGDHRMARQFEELDDAKRFAEKHARNAVTRALARLGDRGL